MGLEVPLVEGELDQPRQKRDCERMRITSMGQGTRPASAIICWNTGHRSSVAQAPGSTYPRHGMSLLLAAGWPTSHGIQVIASGLLRGLAGSVDWACASHVGAHFCLDAKSRAAREAGRSVHRSSLLE